MQKLALLLLFGIVASTMFGFAPTILAQETPEETPETTEETGDAMPEESMDDTAEEEVTDDTMVEESTDEMMDDTMEEMDDSEMAAMDVDSPLEQLKSGTNPIEVQCGDGMLLVYKASNSRPSCIKESSYEILMQRGWVAASTPSDEQLSAMMEGIPQVEEEVTEEVMEEEVTDEETDGDITLEEDINAEDEATSGNGTEPTPQSYTIELSEAMEMGAN